MLRLFFCTPVLFFALTFPLISEAKIGSTLGESAKNVRMNKAYISEVTYYVKSNRVIAENVIAVESGWSQSTADRLRATIVGARRVKSKVLDGGTPTYIYTDGTKVTYQLGDGDRIMGLEATIGKYANSVVSKYQGFQEVYDSKEQPWNGLRW